MVDLAFKVVQNHAFFDSSFLSLCNCVLPTGFPASVPKAQTSRLEYSSRSPDLPFTHVARVERDLLPWLDFLCVLQELHL
jgi:hypothetical protein